MSASTPRVTECVDLLDASEPLRQGDVLEWLGNDRDHWHQYAIVVTADCDIVHRKHAGSIAVVPVLSHDVYLSLFVLSQKLREAEAPLRERIHGLLRRIQERCRPDQALPMSSAAMDEWITHSSAESIIRTLHAEADGDATVAIAIIQWLRALETEVEALDAARQLEMLVTAKVFAGSTKAPEELRLQLAQDNVRRYGSLPGDALFLHSLGGGLAAGYVAYLRRLESLGEAEIALRFYDAKDSGARARRISRLGSPYVFRLTQQLAQVFSDIGLPGTYEQSRDEFISNQIRTFADA